MDFKQVDESEGGYPHGLRLKWCAGLDYNTPNSVINLSSDEKEAFCYISGHTAVIYNYEKKRQKLLQGHSNKITAICYSHTKNIIVTADTGEYNMIVVWSEDTGVPLKTFFEVDELGIRCMDISKDGNYILTLGQYIDGKQTIKVWDWTDSENESPIIAQTAAKINKPNDLFDYIRWNHSDYNEFVTTGRHSVKFWRRDGEGNCQGYSPISSKKEENKNKDNCREFTQTIFIPENNGVQAVTGTNNGFLIVWDTILILEEFSNVNNRREIKSINLLSNSHKKYADKVVSISLLNTYRNMIILGTSVGTIRFYDFRFRIICWFEENEMGTIRSLSFSHKESTEDMYSKSDKIDEEEDLDFPDFIVCDTEACIFKLNASHFKEIDVDKKEAIKLFSSVKKKIMWTSVSPDSSRIAFTTADGKVYEWEMWSNQPLLIKNFETETGTITEVPTTVEYSPDSKYLIVATNQGNVYVRSDLSTGLNVSPLLISHKKKGVVCEKLVFSDCSSYIAISDNHKCVSLFKLGHKYEDKSQPIEWVFSGKVRAHTSKITDLCFIMADEESTYPKLYSIGEDMFLVQYNIEKSKDYLIVDSYEKIEFNDHPTALCFYPHEYLKENLLLIANSGYKLKLWNTVQNHKICRQTVLGPSFGGYVENLKILKPKRKNKHKYLAYSTMNKIIGIIKLPLDGNPNNYIGLISTSGQISHMSVSDNGKYIVIAGEDDLTLNVWRVDYDALESNELLNTTVENPLDIYPSLLEGGEEGDLYRELKDFFYYSQIRRMEENSTKAHKLDGKIPLKEIPNLMIALGYYPTLKEIENMQNEVKYSKMDKNVFVDDLSLKDFVKLFINHRSAYGLTKDYIEDNLKDVFKNPKKIDKKEFLELLTKYGEKMSMNDIKFYLNTLVGEGDVDELLGENISTNKLIKGILGFEIESEWAK